MNIGFTQIISSVVELFGIIYTAGFLLFDWFSKPLADTAGSELVSFLGDLAYFTPFELIFGPGLFIVLVFSVVRFVIGAIS